MCQCQIVAIEQAGQAQSKRGQQFRMMLIDQLADVGEHDLAFHLVECDERQILVTGIGRCVAILVKGSDFFVQQMPQAFGHDAAEFRPIALQPSKRIPAHLGFADAHGLARVLEKCVRQASRESVQLRHRQIECNGQQALQY